MRRAVLSVCANIVEGYSRRTMKDRRHFYQMAVASLTETELEFFIDFAYERKYIKDGEYEKILNIAGESAKILDGLVKATRL